MKYTRLEQVYALIATITCFTITDYLLTQNYLDVVGNEGEANPLMYWVITNFGMSSVLLIKLLGACILAMLVSRVPKKSLDWIYGALISVNSIIFCVVGMGFYAVGTTL